jgi:hypothetical protein
MATRLYSIFQKIDGKWVRQSELAFGKATAVRVFQNRLLAGAFGELPVVELRPIPKPKIDA